MWPGRPRVMLLADPKADVAQVLTGKTESVGRALTSILGNRGIPRTSQ
jgi:hypothetical protein